MVTKVTGSEGDIICAMADCNYTKTLLYTSGPLRDIINVIYISSNVMLTLLQM